MTHTTPPAHPDAHNTPPAAAHPATVKHFASVEHLSLEAVAAYVDGELTAAAMHRARVHLVHCGDCRDEIDTQRRAASLIREQSATITAPAQLVEKLASLATSCPAGPTAERLTACRNPETLLDKVDLLFRAVRRTR